MPLVKLRVFWNPGTDRFEPGDTVEVSDEVAAWLADNNCLTAPLASDDGDVRETTKPVEDDEPVEEDPAPVSGPAPDSDKPAKAAHIDKWREYAKLKGVETKGLTKSEIIAAVS